MKALGTSPVARAVARCAAARREVVAAYVFGSVATGRTRADSDVDVAVLLAHRVLSKGRLVFERSRSARVRFQVRTASRYADVIPMYETQIRS